MSSMITISKSEKFQLEVKAKSGWRCFFIMRENFDGLQSWVNELTNRNRELRKRLEDPHFEMNDLDITYLKRQFVEMYDKLKEYTDCPICFETLTKDNMEVPKCGHILCKTCKEKIMAINCLCPICKKKF